MKLLPYQTLNKQIMFNSNNNCHLINFYKLTHWPTTAAILINLILFTLTLNNQFIKETRAFPLENGKSIECKPGQLFNASEYFHGQKSNCFYNKPNDNWISCHCSEGVIVCRPDANCEQAKFKTTTTTNQTLPTTTAAAAATTLSKGKTNLSNKHQHFRQQSANINRQLATSTKVNQTLSSAAASATATTTTTTAAATSTTASATVGAPATAPAMSTISTKRANTSSGLSWTLGADKSKKNDRVPFVGTTKQTDYDSLKDYIHKRRQELMSRLAKTTTTTPPPTTTTTTTTTTTPMPTTEVDYVDPTETDEINQDLSTLTLPTLNTLLPSPTTTSIPILTGPITTSIPYNHINTDIKEDFLISSNSIDGREQAQQQRNQQQQNHQIQEPQVDDIEYACFVWFGIILSILLTILLSSMLLCLAHSCWYAFRAATDLNFDKKQSLNQIQKYPIQIP